MTTTKLPTDVAFDLLVVEQLHDIVPCENTKCQKPARWTWRHECGEVWINCNTHRRELDEWIAQWPDPEMCFCNRCNLPLPLPLPWVAL